MEIKTRVPGKLIEISVNVGDTVKIKDVLGAIEAMKMKQFIPCPVDGEVKEIRFAVGDRINAGDVLFVVE